MRHAIAASILLLVHSLAIATPPETIWMSVLIDGRKIGHMLCTRKLENGHIVTTQSMQIELDRAGMKIALVTAETNEETTDGKPLAFETRSKISGMQSVVRGRLRDDGQVEVDSEIGGIRQTRIVPWPKDALLAEGLRLSGLRAGLAPETQYSDRAFQSESLDAIEVDSTVRQTDRVILPDGARMLARIEQELKLSGAPERTVAWVDADQTVYKIMLPILGFELTMVACTQACAQAPNQATDMFTHAVVRAPRALSQDDLKHGLRLRISPTSAGDPLQFVVTDEQLATRAGDGAIDLAVTPIDRPGAIAREDKPAPADYRANDWLQSDAPEVAALATQAAGDARTPREQMQHLEQFVRGYIRNKDLSVGYASALEVVKNPEGDCTEHAVLLAALGRALGIATRVVDGLAYTDHFAGGEHLFVPHAWAQAYVDDRWQSFDAALFGFDAGHIALSIGDGDPWRFYAGLNTLGRMRVDAVEPIEAAAPARDAH